MIFKTFYLFIFVLIAIQAVSCRNHRRDLIKINDSDVNTSSIPDSKNPLVVRTYFGSKGNWQTISGKLVQTYESGFRAYIEFLDDKKYKNSKPQEIVEYTNPNYSHFFIFIADSLTFTNPENSVLCIDLYEEIGKSFRVIPSELWGVQNNLSISNMEFSDFYDNCDSDGVFRGFD